MRSTLLYFLILILTLSLVPVCAQSDRVLLSKISALTLRDGLTTTHRRVSAIPQLRCIAGRGCNHYSIDVLRCKNAGSDYDEANVQWTCTASLPSEFKLGSTDVICEGYANSQDPYVLKGSCGIEYTLELTQEGEERYGQGSMGPGGNAEHTANVVFWLIFAGIVGWLLWALWRNRTNANPPPPYQPGFGGGAGGGGGDDDPPPPYYYHSPPKPGLSPSSAQGWRPGFWSGMAGGAAAGFLANQRRNDARPAAGPSDWYDRDRSGSSGSSSSSTRYESTGFGSSSRR